MAVDAARLNFSKAFDTVVRSILLKKLAVHGLDSYSGKLAECPHPERGGEWSDIHLMAAPQNPALRPVLHLYIFVHQLYGQGHRVHLHSNGTKLDWIVHLPESKKALQRVLNGLDLWAKEKKGMNFNKADSK